MWDNDFWVELWCDFVLEPFSLSLVFLCACLFLKKKKKKKPLKIYWNGLVLLLLFFIYFNGTQVC